MSSAAVSARDASHRAPQPAMQFDDAGQQRAAAQLGMWVFLATEVLFFGVLFASYVLCRIRFPEAFALGSRHTDVVLGSIEAVILLVSSAVVTWAVALVALDERRLVVRLLAFAALLGLAFLALHGIEYWNEYHEGLMPGVAWTQVGEHAATMQQFFFLYYAMTLYHSLHVTIGVGVLVTLAVMTHNGRIGSIWPTPLVVGGLYWHLVDIVWIFLFPLIYLVDRS